MSRKIQLSQGKVALVSERDFAFINSFKWYAKNSGATWYAVRQEGVNRYACRGLQKSARKKRKRRIIRMHNLIMHPSDDEVVHHKNSDGLNNDRENLECCSVRQNVKYTYQKRRENVKG